jgi:glycosyltransferase involved in cell wall biosynthesis
MNNKKKVLFIIEHWGIGGTEKSVKTLIENLSDEWEKELLLLRNVQIAKMDDKRMKFPFPQNTKINRIEKSSSISILFSLIKFLKKSSPHIISTHFIPTGSLLFLIFIAKKFARIPAPIIATIHASYYLDFPTKSLKDLLLLPLKKYIIKWGVAYIVSYCYSLEKMIVEKLGVPRKKVSTIYNPIVGEEMFENAKEEPPEYKEFSDSIKVVVVSRLSIYKDFLTILRAFAIFRRKNQRAKLFIVGEGPDREQIIQWANELKLEGSVLLLGARPNPYPYIKYADIFIFSYHVAGVARVLVEAMALGCPVVVADYPNGPGEVIKNNENGILVPMRDPTAMAEGMMRILEDEDLRKRIIENGKRKAEEFRISSSVRKREELFRKLLIRSKRKREAM